MVQASLGDSGVLVDPPSTDEMSSSGILVEEPIIEESPTGGRRIVKANAPTLNSSGSGSGSGGVEEEDDAGAAGADPVTIISPSNDEELLQESIEHSRQKRLQQLAADQRSKRSTKQAKGRTNPSRNAAQANPFSRFLTAFSVDTKYPHHKRSYDESDSYEEEPPSKHARVESEDYADNVGDESGAADETPVMDMLSDVAETLRENISLMAVGAAVASLALMTLIRKKA